MIIDFFKIICGQDHSLFLTEKGEIYSCGWGSDGQTGLGHFNDVSTPTKIGGDIKGEKIIDVSSAVDCALAVNGNLNYFYSKQNKNIFFITKKNVFFFK